MTILGAIAVLIVLLLATLFVAAVVNAILEDEGRKRRDR